MLYKRAVDEKEVPMYSSPPGWSPRSLRTTSGLIKLKHIYFHGIVRGFLDILLNTVKVSFDNQLEQKDKQGTQEGCDTDSKSSLTSTYLSWFFMPARLFSGSRVLIGGFC